MLPPPIMQLCSSSESLGTSHWLQENSPQGEGIAPMGKCQNAKMLESYSNKSMVSS